MKTIKVLFLGDEGVGKTTLISTILSDSFPLQVQRVIPPVTIPLEMSPFSDKAETHLIDSSSLPEHMEATISKIKSASVIILVYDILIPESKERVTTFWLPRISHENEAIPVIVVGNKLDLRPPHENHEKEHKQFIDGMVFEFPQVEMGIECSAKLHEDLTDLIYCAQRAVLYPIYPLFDHRTKELKPKYVGALKRIFRICDVDQDKYLNNSELYDFQKRIFTVDISEEDINAIKEVLIEECEAYREEEKEKGLNLPSFICLNKLLLLKQKPQACWTILFKFGYDTTLALTDTYIDSKYSDLEEFDENSEIELSSKGIDFLKGIWNSNTQNEAVADIYVLEGIFATMEEGCPFIPMEVTIIREGKISIKTWISIWQMLVYTNYETAFKYALYIGYEEPFKEFVTISKKGSWSIFGQREKTVYGCALIERLPTTLNRLVGSVREAQSSAPRSAAFPIPDLEKESTVVMSEFAGESVKEISKVEGSQLSKYDLCILVHDGSKESYNFIKATKGKLPEELPKAVIDISPESHSMAPYIPLGEVARMAKLPSEAAVKLPLSVDKIDSLIEFIMKIIQDPYFVINLIRIGS